MKKSKKWKEDTKLFKSLSDCCYKCSCGHSVIMTRKIDKVICSHCGNYVFKSKKDEFEFRLKEKMKKRG